MAFCSVAQPGARQAKPPLPNASLQFSVGRRLVRIVVPVVTWWIFAEVDKVCWVWIGTCFEFWVSSSLAKIVRDVRDMSRVVAVLIETLRVEAKHKKKLASGCFVATLIPCETATSVGLIVRSLKIKSEMIACNFSNFVIFLKE